MQRLGDILVAMGRITPEQIEQALRSPGRGGKPLGATLKDLGLINEDDIARALSIQLDVPLHEFDDQYRLKREEVKLLPEAVARRFGVVALWKESENSATLVMSDPLDLDALDTVRSLITLDVAKAVSSPLRIKGVIDRSYTEEAHIERNLQEIADAEVEDVVTNVDGGAVNAEQLRLLANDAPVVKFVNLLLMQAVRDRASDIHFEPHETEVKVRLRIDGVLHEVTPPPKALYSGVVTRIKILSNMDISERRLPLDGRFKFGVHGRMIDVRVSSLPEVYGEKLVLRLLDRDALRVNMKDIGFGDDMLTRFHRILKEPHGIVLLTGPTGSGKTSTLYSALSFLRSPEVNIQTVEDPVEYQLRGINQMAVKSHIGLTFASGLRAILRQDPDIIMIGEIRDAETAQIAMRSALTGHLVLSTLHTNDAPSTFWRLHDIGVELYLIAATINLVISQRLVRVLCKHCKHEVKPTLEEVKVASLVDPQAHQWTYYKGAGCPHCNHTGFRGRIGIFEFLEVTDSVRELIMSGAGTVAVRQKAMEEGMESLLASGLNQVKCGNSTVEEVLSVAPLGELQKSM